MVVCGVVGAVCCLMLSDVERCDVAVVVGVAVALPLILREKRPVQLHIA